MKRQGEDGHPQTKEFLRPPEARRKAGDSSFLTNVRMCTHLYPRCSQENGSYFLGKTQGFIEICPKRVLGNFI